MCLIPLPLFPPLRKLSRMDGVFQVNSKNATVLVKDIMARGRWGHRTGCWELTISVAAVELEFAALLNMYLNTFNFFAISNSCTLEKGAVDSVLSLEYVLVREPDDGPELLAASIGRSSATVREMETEFGIHVVDFVSPCGSVPIGEPLTHRIEVWRYAYTYVGVYTCI